MTGRLEDLWETAASDGASTPFVSPATNSDAELEELMTAWYHERTERTEVTLLLDRGRADRKDHRDRGDYSPDKEASPQFSSCESRLPARRSEAKKLVRSLEPTRSEPRTQKKENPAPPGAGFSYFRYQAISVFTTLARLVPVSVEP